LIGSSKAAFLAGNKPKTKPKITAKLNEVNKAETQSMRKPADTMQNMWCPLCEVNAIISKKTGKPYCPTFKKHPQGQYISLTAKPSEKEQEFEKSLDIDEINSMI